MDDNRDMIVIEQSEYRELVIKAFLYDLLKEEIPKAHALSTAECVLLGIENEEK